MIQIIPTDTCYGLAGVFTETDYLEIYQLKGRDFAKPLALLVEDYEDMRQYIEITDEQIEFLRTYHRPWSCLGRRICSLPEWMDADQYSRLSLRVARVCFPIVQPFRHGGLAANTSTLSFPLYLTSANLSGQSESKTLAEARVSFP
jgi:tRNA A37 threonylcarbamoyladenosine synthetase subunit TsaC/SUA5/YrdC